MTRFLLGVLFLLPSLSYAQVKFSFTNEEITKIVETYAKVSKQKFIIDPGVRGRATITSSDNVTVEEAFNLLSSALAVNGYAISTQGDLMVIKSARNIQRDLLETATTLPALKPERQVSYVITLKNVPATVINRELRILPSKDGELSVFSPKNQIIITDWVSNLHRIDALIKQLDQPVDPKMAKIIEEGRKLDERSARMRGPNPHFAANPMMTGEDMPLPPPTPGRPGKPTLPEPRTKRLQLDQPASGQ